MYTVKLMPRAIKDLKRLPKSQVLKILSAVERLDNGLDGDIKRLTHFTPEYRLRVGNYRVLFEVEGERLNIYRIKHRREAYT